MANRVAIRPAAGRLRSLRKRIYLLARIFMRKRIFTP